MIAYFFFLASDTCLLEKFNKNVPPIINILHWGIFGTNINKLFPGVQEEVSQVLILMA